MRRNSHSRVRKLQYQLFFLIPGKKGGNLNVAPLRIMPDAVANEIPKGPGQEVGVGGKLNRFQLSSQIQGKRIMRRFRQLPVQIFGGQVP